MKRIVLTERGRVDRIVRAGGGVRGCGEHSAERKKITVSAYIHCAYPAFPVGEEKHCSLHRP